MPGPEGSEPAEPFEPADPVAPPAFVPLHEPTVWQRVREVAAQSPWRERIALDRRAVCTAVITVVVVLVVGVAVLRSDGGTGPPAQITLPTAPRPAAAASAPAAEVVVHVTGAVQRSGVYRLPVETRVGEAIEAAGGAVADADLESVNLAAPLGDGERVYVPHRGEQPVAPAGDAGTGSAPAVVNVNSASAGDLDALPGVGPSLAAAIVEHRKQHGRFASVDSLLDVPGIGPAKLASLRPRVRV